MKKKEKNSLFREFVRQLRLPGILITVFMTVMTALITGNTLDMRILVTPATGQRIDVFDIFEVQFFVSWLIAPILVIMALSFLRKRSASDFYHSAGVKKTSLFLSSVGAAMFWFALAVVISCAVGILTCYTRRYLFIIDYFEVILYLAGFLVTGFLSGSVASFACSLTGTGFTAVTAYISIAYAPYVFLSIAGDVLRRNMKAGSVGHSDNILEKICDLDLLCYFGYDKCPTVWQILFTLGLGAVVFVLALYAFAKRKSETAETAAVSTPVRIILSCSLFFIPTAYVVGSGTFANDMATVICLFVLGFGFIVYELGITKKTATVLTSLPWLALTYFAAYLPRLVGYLLSR